MKEIEVEISNPTGLHARPAATFVNLAKQFQADIHIQNGTKKINAKRIISVLTLGAKQGQRLIISADGVDEDDALQALKSAVEQGLGDDIPTEKTPTRAEKSIPQPSPQSASKDTAHIVTGIPGSPGIAIGTVHQFQKIALDVPPDADNPTEELAALRNAISAAKDALDTLHADVTARIGAAEAEIFAAHQAILSDDSLSETAAQLIRAGRSAAWAWQNTIETTAAELASVDNAVLAARAADIRDVGNRVLRYLLKSPDTEPNFPDTPVILIAEDLTPSDTASLDHNKILGLCTAEGGANAHTAILARALGLPAIVGCGRTVLSIPNGTQVILDGTTGTLNLSPDEHTIKMTKLAQEKERNTRAEHLRAAKQPAHTSDGTLIDVMANIGGVADAEKSVTFGADGVGLLRTEFLFLERQTAPTEDEQFVVYRDIAMAMKNKPVIVRTLDVGGDKPLPYLSVPDEQNPFLGNRGIRLCLAQPEILRTQLRAIFRAAQFGTLKIMFPMVATLEEWNAAHALVESVRAELSVPPVEVGIMVEIPSAALMAHMFARHVDFFSIGTNDLTQYTLAMDRTNPAVSGGADGLHPAVLRLIDATVRAAHTEGKSVGVCGELAADPQAVPILVGLGVDELSVSVPGIPAVKAAIRTLSNTKAQKLAATALQQSTAAAVRTLTLKQ